MLKILLDENLPKKLKNYHKWNVKLIVLDTFDNQYETVLPFVEKIKKLFEQGTIQDYNWIER